MKNNIYKSILKDRIFNFINFKQEQDYKYKGEISQIRLFDKFLSKENYKKELLTIEIVDKYIISIKNKSIKTRHNNFSVLKEFSNYLKMFEDKSYQIIKNIFRNPPRKKSYIFSKKEIELLLKSFYSHKKADDVNCISNYTILGVLTFTGIRIQECLNLNIKHWDQANKLLFIKDGKFGKDRLIPIDESVNNKLKEYYNERLKYKSNDKEEPLFINRKLERLKQSSFRKFFNEKLEALNINNNGLDCRKPVVHSLRHFFAVTTLLKWVKTGLNTNEMLPYLSTYMGHISLESTQIYLQSINEIDDLEYKKFYQTFKNNI